MVAMTPVTPMRDVINIHKINVNIKYATQKQSTVISYYRVYSTISSIKQNYRYALCYVLLLDRTLVKVELLAWVVVYPFVRRLSVCHGCIVAKRCKIDPKLLLITNISRILAFK